MSATRYPFVLALVLTTACETTGVPFTGISTFGSGAATRLVFTVQPSNSLAGAAITPPVRVSAVTSAGSIDTTFVNVVTVAVGANPSGGSLSGFTSVGAIGGAATFNSLSINSAGSGYTLTASAPGVSFATSAGFNVTVTPVSPP